MDDSAANRNQSETRQTDHTISPDATAIIEAALMHVPFDGWTMDALEAGASDAGFSATDVGTHFPGGPIDAVIAHSAIADQNMLAAFAAMDPAPEKIHLMIRTLILIRLEQAAMHKEAVRRALTLLALPANTIVSGKALYRTVDAMWRAAGQRDTDFSFYTKRATLAGVYSATLLAWIADTNGDMNAVEAFLDRRLKDVARIPQASAPLKSVFGMGQKMAASVAGVMAQRAGRSGR